MKQNRDLKYTHVHIETYYIIKVTSHVTREKTNILINAVGTAQYPFDKI